MAFQWPLHGEASQGQGGAGEERDLDGPREGFAAAFQVTDAHLKSISLLMVMNHTRIY